MKKEITFEDFEKLDLRIGEIVSAKKVEGADKLLQRIRALTEFHIDAIHFTYCIKSLCPFKEKYKKALEETFPEIRIILGTHEEHITPEEFRHRVKKLFRQPRLSMADVILGKD